jgi:hypothetical protein
MKQIEYEVVTFNGVVINEKDMKRRLNDLGAQGWQAVTMSYNSRDPSERGAGQIEITVILMRLKKP